jgi:hypothetical protein
MEMDAATKLAYFDAVMSEYESRRGSFLAVTSADWHVATGWWERKIPLRVVLTAMKLCKDPASGPPRSLSWFSGAVEEEVRRVQRAMTA